MATSLVCKDCNALLASVAEAQNHNEVGGREGVCAAFSSTEEGAEGLVMLWRTKIEAFVRTQSWCLEASHRHSKPKHAHPCAPA